MKALTIRQPWAELIMSGRKDVENRSRPIAYRGRFAVHVALRRADVDDLDLEAMPKRLRAPILAAWQDFASPGRVIGTVELVDCVADSRSPWAMAGSWHWLLRDPRPYRQSVPAKGRLNLWNWQR